MAQKHSLVINSVTQSGVKNQKTLTDINAEASGAVLKEFAERLNALTTNTYGSTTRIGKEPLPSASDLLTCGVAWPFDADNDFPDDNAGHVDPDNPYRFIISFSSCATCGNNRYFNGFKRVELTADVLLPVPRPLSAPTYGCAPKAIHIKDNAFYLEFDLAEAAFKGVEECKAGVLGDYVYYVPQTGDYAPLTLTISITDD